MYKVYLHKLKKNNQVLIVVPKHSIQSFFEIYIILQLFLKLLGN